MVALRAGEVAEVPRDQRHRYPKRPQTDRQTPSRFYGCRPRAGLFRLPACRRSRRPNGNRRPDDVPCSAQPRRRKTMAHGRPSGSLFEQQIADSVPLTSSQLPGPTVSGERHVRRRCPSGHLAARVCSCARNRRLTRGGLTEQHLAVCQLASQLRLRSVEVGVAEAEDATI
jgi:hypothetical protein